MRVESLLELTHWDFDYTIRRHKFIAVLFFHPYDGFSIKLLREYEKAANLLITNNHPVHLAAVDVTKNLNNPIVLHFKIWGFPMIKIFRDGSIVKPEEYMGPRDAHGIADCLKRLTSRFPVQIDSLQALIGSSNKIAIVGFFVDFSGQEYDNFVKTAEKLRWDYDLHFTKPLPDGECFPVVRLYNLFEDENQKLQTNNFNVDALVEFLKDASPHVVTLYEHHHRFVQDFFYSNSDNAKAMLFNKSDDINAFDLKSKYFEIAKKYKGRDINFMLGGLESSKDAFQYFGLEYFGFTPHKSPLLTIRGCWGKRYAKLCLDHDIIEGWVDDFKDGRLAEFGISEPIPQEDELVKVVVGDNFDDEVMKSEKIVLLQVHRKMRGNFKELAPILNEVAIHFKEDDKTLIATLDETSNDIRSKYREELKTIGDGPTIYLITPDYVELCEPPFSVEGFIDLVINEIRLVMQDTDSLE